MKRPDDVKNRLKGHIKAGRTQREIAVIEGVAQATVGRWVRGLGLATKGVRGVKKGARAYLCRYCGETDPGQFVWSRFGSRSFSRCKACHANRSTTRYREKKRLAVEFLGGKCVRCNYDKCIGAMHFHHRDPSQKDPEWKLIKNRSFAALKKEIAKCDLVCANCHAEIHWELSGAAHGLVPDALPPVRYHPGRQPERLGRVSDNQPAQTERL